MEIDESKFGKRKYHRGRRVDGVRVFGGIERESRCFMVSVEDRTVATLIPIINNTFFLEQRLLLIAGRVGGRIYSRYCQP